MNQYTKYQSRFGEGILQWREGLLVTHLLPGTGGAASAARRTVAATGDVARRLTGLLRAYFNGERVDFAASGLPVDWDAFTPFQQQVARALTVVPYRETISYAGLAARAGRPGAARAVGNFMAANPLPLLLPCHRVIRNDGQPGRYLAGEDYKRRLLQMEGSLPSPDKQGKQLQTVITGADRA
ncbi:MAG: methylated-DNA--[protein]-cysteine S-methyltransferase [Thermoleophilia bacterium]